MNAKSLIAASALAIIGTSALAFETPDIATPSTLSRAAVVAELVRAQQAGEIPRSSQPYFDVDAALVSAQKHSGLSRAQVRQELAAAPAVGTRNEAYGSFVPGESQRSRSAVHSEAAGAAHARADGAE